MNMVSTLHRNDVSVYETLEKDTFFLVVSFFTSIFQYPINEYLSLTYIDKRMTITLHRYPDICIRIFFRGHYCPWVFMRGLLYIYILKGQESGLH